SELTATLSCGDRSRAANRPISARLEPARRLRGVEHWFLAYTLSSGEPGPHRLAVPARPVVVGAASHPPRRPPDQAAPRFTRLLRQPGGGVLSPPLGHTAPRGARSHPRADATNPATARGSPLPAGPAAPPRRRRSPSAWP